LRKYWGILAALTILGLIVFGYSMTFGFALDDESQIVLNEKIHSLSNIYGAFFGSTMGALGAKNMAGIYYKPIMTVCYIILWFLSGHEAPLFHVFQWILHVGNCFMLYLLFSYIFSNSKIIPVLVSLLYLIHPINVESVIYIADLQDVLYMFFGLLLLNYLKDLKKITVKDQGIIFALYVCSLLSKESGFLYLILANIFCFFYVRRFLKRTTLLAISAFLFYLFLRFEVASLNMSDNSSQMMRASLDVRLMTMPKALLHYLITFVFPKDLTLVQDWAVYDVTFRDYFLPLLILLSLVGLAIFYGWKHRTDRRYLFFGAWMLIGMGFHSQLVPLDGTVADRWFYFPMIGFLGMLTVMISNLSQATLQKYQRVFVGSVAVLILVLSGRAFARTLDWVDNFTLYSHDLALQPDSFYLTNNVGVELYRRGQFEEAKPYFEKIHRAFSSLDNQLDQFGCCL